VNHAEGNLILSATLNPGQEKHDNTQMLSEPKPLEIASIPELAVIMQKMMPLWKFFFDDNNIDNIEFDEEGAIDYNPPAAETPIFVHQQSSASVDAS
jgi:hypothetical protein